MSMGEVRVAISFNIRANGVDFVLPTGHFGEMSMLYCPSRRLFAFKKKIRALLKIALPIRTTAMDCLAIGKTFCTSEVQSHVNGSHKAISSFL